MSKFFFSNQIELQMEMEMGMEMAVESNGDKSTAAKKDITKRQRNRRMQITEKQNRKRTNESNQIHTPDHKKLPSSALSHTNLFVCLLLNI